MSNVRVTDFRADLPAAEGGAGEKKFYRAAIESYESYLEIFSHAGDTGKVRKRIEKLKAKMEKRRR
ncbi:MAG: hypothetical protein LAN71_03940 [Acidobacteriia bacterium]|nr:hypothetical protein [Terriglobia bacterium]